MAAPPLRQSVHSIRLSARMGLLHQNFRWRRSCRNRTNPDVYRPHPGVGTKRPLHLPPKGGLEQRPFHGGIWRDLTPQFVSNMTDVWENRHSPASVRENSDQFVRSCPGSSRKPNLFWLARIVQPHECQNTAMLRDTNGAALPWLLMLSPNDDPSRTGAGEHCALSFPWPAFGNSAAFGRAKDHGVDRSLARYRTRNGEAVFRGRLADHHLFAPAFRWRPVPLGCWIE